MTTRTDILWEEGGDLRVDQGDFVLGLSDDQHVQDILEANPGDFKEIPIMGSSIVKAKNGALDGRLKNRIRINMQMDDYRVKSLVQNEEEILIDYE